MTSIALIAFTRKGCQLAQGLAAGLVSDDRYASAVCPVSGPARLAAELGIEAYTGLDAWTTAHFPHDDALIFVGASGIAVRAIAPHVRDKMTDPAVVCVDEAGRVAVPLLSGHVGGANELARVVAAITGGQAAVSTATDVNGLFAVDGWAARHGLAIVERDAAKAVSVAFLEGDPVGFRNDAGVDLGDDAPVGTTDGPADIGFVVSFDTTCRPYPRTLHLVPRVTTVGVGCRKGIPPEVLRQAVDDALAEAGVPVQAVAAIASIDVKRDEPAIVRLAQEIGCELRFYSADELAAVPGRFSSSAFVRDTVGVDNVCERAACVDGATLVAGRRAGGGVTVAVAMQLTAGGQAGCGTAVTRGSLFVVGIGPGGAGDMTGRARVAIESSDLIVGYTTYVDLLRDGFPGKRFATTPMRKEVDRCRMALDEASQGTSVAMVCSGDPGVYGMAGLLYELSPDYPGVDIQVVSGVSASNGGAAVLGAPLMHDHCIISLSDLLTPWETIERRLSAAAQADLVICLYNPSSRKRRGHLRRACDILLRYQDPATVCGTVRNIGREGEEAHVMTLAELRDTQVDMFTCVFVGNSQTTVIDGKMVTPRGYLRREG